MDRRQFLLSSAGAMASLAGLGTKTLASEFGPIRNIPKSKVSIVKTTDRKAGIRQAIELLEANPVKDKDILLKPNFNTADPFPASTHIDTLEELVIRMREMGARKITIGERSGPPETSDVIKDLGIDSLAKRLGAGLVNFEDLPPEDWVKVRPEKSHWRDGFDVARPVLDAQCVVSTCCLKTHRFGGVFTMSLKLSVGITHKRNMSELHSSFLSMRKMIAEINQAYSPSLIVMDGMEVFVDGGPMTGTKKTANLILAGSDRVAIDAVGVAILKELGSNDAIMKKKIFKQEQIKRASELGLGIGKPEEIILVTGDSESRKYAERIEAILLEG